MRCSIVLLKYAWPSLKKTSSGCSKTCIYLSALMVPFHMCGLQVPKPLMQLHTIRDAGFWGEYWWEARWNSFLFSLKDTVFMIFKNNFKLQTVSYFALFCFKWYFFLIMFTHIFFFPDTFNLHCGWKSELWSQTIISWCVPEPTQWFQQQNHNCF